MGSGQLRPRRAHCDFGSLNVRTLAKFRAILINDQQVVELHHPMALHHLTWVAKQIDI